MLATADQPAQLRERRLPAARRLLAAPRAAFVPRRERECQQQFVLQQVVHRHFPAGGDPFRTLGLDRIRIHFGLRRRKLKHDLYMQRILEGAEAALAGQLQRAVDLQPERRVPLLLRHTQQYILERPFLRAQRIAQARKIGNRPCPLQLRAGPREFKAVDDRLMRHTAADGIILKNLCQNKAMPSPRPVVLASTSRYRRTLLERLGFPFECADPKTDEAGLPGEAPGATALRLAEAKARAAARRFPQALIIGSDQVASCDGVRLEKPGTHENAVRQLTAMSGKVATFDTAVAVLDAKANSVRTRLVPCRVTFRTLSSATIETYLRKEKPYDCAGSAKAEGLGITLIARIDTEDPTSLVGLPLIALTELLAAAGMPVLG
jgi:septum formation protein